MLVNLRKKIFDQEIHTGCTDQSKDATLSLEGMIDGYIAINAYELALSDHEEIDELAKLLHEFYDENTESNNEILGYFKP